MQQTPADRDFYKPDPLFVMPKMKQASRPASPELLSAVMSYQHPELVHRLTIKLGIPGQEAKLRFEDMLRFLYLCGTSGECLAPTARIDDAWHEFIVYMKDYERFCIDHFGRLIYHRPNPQLVVRYRPLIEQGLRTRELAQKAFGVLSTNWDPLSDDPCSDGECAPDYDCDAPDPN